MDEAGCLYSNELCRPRSDPSESSRGETVRAAVVVSEASTDGERVAKRKTVQTHFRELCEGYSPDLIADWCGVDYKSALQFKSGQRSPGAQALRLFLLNRDGRILGAEWEGFSIRGGTMWDPYGKPLTAGQLRAYEIALQMLRELMRGNPLLNRELDALFHQAARLSRRPGEASAASGPVEAKPSAFVRYASAESVRMRNSRRKNKAADPLAKPAAKLRLALAAKDC